MNDACLTFDDISIVPNYSEVLSRKDVSLLSRFTRNYYLDVPIIAAPMDTVCDVDMAFAMWQLGACGILHRFMSIEDQVDKIVDLRHLMEADSNHKEPLIVCSIGATGDYLERAEASLYSGANILLIDVAHGHHIHVKNALTELMKLKSKFTFDIIAGNIVTSEAARDLQLWGADCIRCGLGSGSSCSTRINTGIGIPQIQAIINCVGNGIEIPVIADGGIRYPGDVCKAIAVGANSVMLGNLLAGTIESPGSIIRGQWPKQAAYKEFRGSASLKTKIETNQETRNIEGVSTTIPLKGFVKDIITDITDGLRSSMSYVGAHTIPEFQEKAIPIRVTHSGNREAHPHSLGE